MSEIHEALQKVYDLLRQAGEDIFRLKKKEESVSFTSISEQVWNHFMYDSEEWVWVIDIFVDNPNGMFAIVAKEGLLYQCSLAVNEKGITYGELVQVQEVFVPVSQSRLVLRQSSEGTRWFLSSSSTVLNRNAYFNTKELFDNLNKRAQDSGKYPFLTFYHLGESMKMGVADWVSRDENILLASGLFEKDNLLADLMVKAYEADPEYYGSSIAFWPLDYRMVEIAEGVSVPAYTDGEYDEISILAEKDACAMLTALKIKGVTQMRDELKDEILRLAGGDQALADQIIVSVEDKNKEIQAKGLLHQNADPTVVEPTEEISAVAEATSDVAPVVDPAAPAAEVEVSDELVDEIVQKIVAHPSYTAVMDTVSQSITSLSDAVEAFRSELAEFRGATNAEAKKLRQDLSGLLQEEDKKKAEWQADLPRVGMTRVTHRAKQSEGPANTVEEAKDYSSIAEETLANIK